MTRINDARVVTEGIRPYAAEDQKERTRAKTQAPRRLLTREELEMMLALNNEQVQLLISTRQITKLRIAGEERFDSRDIDALIDAYKATAQRRAAQ